MTTNLKGEGEPLKQYRLSYGGEFLGSYDTAKEALAEYIQHNEDIRPLIDRAQKWRYLIRDGRTRKLLSLF